MKPEPTIKFSYHDKTVTQAINQFFKWKVCGLQYKIMTSATDPEHVVLGT